MELWQKKEITPAKETIPKIINKYKNGKTSKEGKKKIQIITNYYNQILKVEKFLSELTKKLDGC